MWQRLSKFLNPKKDKWPAWMEPFIVKVKDQATYELFSKEVAKILLDNPPGHRVSFLVNGKSHYCIRDSKNNITLKEEE